MVATRLIQLNVADIYWALTITTEMGTGSSFLRGGQDEDDVLGVEYSSSQGVIKRIPIEVKPRGRLGLRSVRSLGKPKGGSLRSALSIDLENPEVEKIRKDFDMYRLNKENELANNQKKVRYMHMALFTFRWLLDLRRVRV